MADEQVVDKDVKEVVTDSSTVTDQNGQATPPAKENLASEQADNKIPYPRFNEVIQERNRERELREQYESRIRDLEHRMSSVPTKPAGSEEIERLVKKGISEEMAKEIVHTADVVSERKNRETQAQIAQYQLAEWHRNMESKYKDYRETTPEMEKVFSKLDPVSQRMVTASPVGLDMLYQYAKSGKGIEASKKAFEAGAQHASQVKDLKKAISSTPGSGSKDTSKELSEKVIREMPIAEYQKRQVEINDWVAGKHTS